MQPMVDGRVQSLLDVARRGSGLATIYAALDHLVAQYDLRDAAIVIDVARLGRQVLHAGRRPLHNDEGGLHEAEPGLYLDPPVPDPRLEEALGPLMLAVSALALRVDTGETLDDGPT